MSRYAGLEIDERIEFQTRFHTGQRVAALLSLFVLTAAVLGVFGTGPLAHATSTGRGGLRVEYDRFVRAEASTRLTVTLPAAARGPTPISLSSGYLQDVQIGNVSPQPSTERTLPERQVFTVDAAPSSEVQFTVTPVQMGIRHLTIETPGGRRVRLTQVVYP